MNKFLISLDKFFNKLLILSFIVFIIFFLGACGIKQKPTINNQDIFLSQARIEYQNMQAFKQKNESFYKQFK